MSRAFGNYEERLSYPRGCNNRTEGRLTVYDIVEEALNLRHTTSGNIAAGGSTIHHLHECPYRDGTWTPSTGQRELEPSAMRDIIRRNHWKVDQVNRTIGPRAVWSEVHPKLKYDGTYPKEFNLPKMVDDFRAIDSSVLDRILFSYNLIESSGCNNSERKSRSDVRLRKLWRLFEFLGADHLTPKRGEEDLHCMKYERCSSW